MQAYIYQAAFLCSNCARMTIATLGPQNGREDSDKYPQGPYGDGGGEADSPHHCDNCAVFLRNPLTTDGMAYVRQQVANAHMVYPQEGICTSVALTEWAPFYGIYPEDEEGDCFDANRHADHGDR